MQCQIMSLIPYSIIQSTFLDTSFIQFAQLQIVAEIFANTIEVKIRIIGSLFSIN